MKKDKDKDFETLFKRHYSTLYFCALNITNDAATSEDIVEDVFEKLWEEYDTLVIPNQDPLPLLYTYVRNKSIDHLRHAEVKSRYEQTLCQLQVWEEYDTPDDFPERMERIKKAIDLLPAQTRKVFEACFLKGKKYKEVADELGISVNTVKTLIARALRTIRDRANRE